MNCPEAKQLEYFVLKTLDQGVLDPEIEVHLQVCLDCQMAVNKWKLYLKSNIFLLSPQLKNYEILRLLGIGTFTKVYLARHTLLNHLVAIKILEYKEDTPESQEIFLQKNRQLAQIQHPNIAKLLDMQMDVNGICYFVFEYFEGESLEKHLPLPIHSAIVYMEQMALALKELHRQNFLLEDIKPNVFLLNESLSKIYIIDFGYFKARNFQGTHTNSFAALFPFYKSPEHCLGSPITQASDVYSLGATFYAMLNGIPAFSGFNLPETFRQVLNVAPPDLTVLHPEVPKTVNEMIQQMMKKIPEDRFTLDQVLTCLGYALQKSPKPLFPKKLATCLPSKNTEIPGASLFLKKNVPQRCSRCFETQKEFFTCIDCGERLCLKHQEKDKKCEICLVHEEPFFLGKDIMEAFRYFEQYSHKKVLPNLNKIPTTEELWKVFESLANDPFGGFLIFTLQQKRQIGLLFQPGTLRIFFYKNAPIRSLVQLLRDFGAIQSSASILPINALEELSEELFQKMVKLEYKQKHLWFKRCWIAQEILPFLASVSCSLRYISGKAPDKFLSTVPDIQIHCGKETLLWMEYLGYAVWTLDQPGTLLLRNQEKKELGIQLEDHRICLVCFQKQEETHSVSWEDHLLSSQLSFLDQVEQERSLRDGDFCTQKQNSGKGSAIQRTRAKIVQEINQFLSQPLLQVEFLQRGIPQATLYKVYTLELVGDYRTFLIALLSRISILPKKFKTQEILELIYQQSNCRIAAKVLWKAIQENLNSYTYEKEFGPFESILLRILTLKVLFWSVYQSFLELNQKLTILNRQEEQQSILETGLLLFPHDKLFSEKFSALSQTTQSQKK